jgi:hypothetical protein
LILSLTNASLLVRAFPPSWDFCGFMIYIISLGGNDIEMGKVRDVGAPFCLLMSLKGRESAAHRR